MKTICLSLLTLVAVGFVGVYMTSNSPIPITPKCDANDFQ